MSTAPARASDPPDLAILYWFYKAPAVTKNHLELIRETNPDCKIYGLFGGDPRRRKMFRTMLGNLLDDFWTYRGTYGADADSKWVHGDLLLLDWYDKQGRNLEWASLAVVQWDMLLFADVRSIVPGLRSNQVFFTGYRDLDSTIEGWWEWTKPHGEDRRDYLAFRRYVAQAFGYRGNLKCCAFLFEILTRQFFEGYLEIPDKYLGMLEYKDPTLAYVFGLDICEADIGFSWEDDELTPLNAVDEYIDRDRILKEQQSADGWRLFHPYIKAWSV